MTGWIVTGSILLALFLLSLLRLGAEVSYGERGLTLRVRVGQIWFSLYPSRKKQKKQKQKSKAQPKRRAKAKPQPAGHAQKTMPPKEEQPETPAEENAKKGGLPIPLMDLISLILDAASSTIARLQIDALEVSYTIAGKEDPARAAIQYGLICAGEGGLVPVLENSFYRVKRRDIRAQVDFESRMPLIWLRLTLSIRLGQLISIACQAGWAFLKVYRQTQEGNDNGTEASDQ